MRRVAVVTLLLSAIGGLGFVAMRRAGPIARHPIVAMRLMRADAPRRLPMPVVGVRARQIRDSWGTARPGGRRHQGIDIFAPRGRAIVSTTQGIVTRVGQNALGGRVVGVLGPGGQWHYYAHLEDFAGVREGQVIAAGTVLGFVGDSGNARGTPPHLHYGIYRLRGGGPVNPYPLLALPRPTIN